MNCFRQLRRILWIAYLRTVQKIYNFGPSSYNLSIVIATPLLLCVFSTPKILAQEMQIEDLEYFMPGDYPTLEDGDRIVLGSGAVVTAKAPQANETNSAYLGNGNYGHVYLVEYEDGTNAALKILNYFATSGTNHTALEQTNDLQNLQDFGLRSAKVLETGNGHLLLERIEHPSVGEWLVKERDPENRQRVLEAFYDSFFLVHKNGFNIQDLQGISGNVYLETTNIPLSSQSIIWVDPGGLVPHQGEKIPSFLPSELAAFGKRSPHTAINALASIVEFQRLEALMNIRPEEALLRTHEHIGEQMNAKWFFKMIEHFPKRWNNVFGDIIATGLKLNFSNVSKTDRNRSAEAILKIRESLSNDVLSDKAAFLLSDPYTDVRSRNAPMHRLLSVLIDRGAMRQLLSKTTPERAKEIQSIFDLKWHLPLSQFIKRTTNILSLARRCRDR